MSTLLAIPTASLDCSVLYVPIDNIIYSLGPPFALGHPKNVTGIYSMIMKKEQRKSSPVGGAPYLLKLRVLSSRNPVLWMSTYVPPLTTLTTALDTYKVWVPREKWSFNQWTSWTGNSFKSFISQSVRMDGSNLHFMGLDLSGLTCWQEAFVQ